MNLNYRIMTKKRVKMNRDFDRTYTVRMKGKVNTQTAEKFSEETLKSGRFFYKTHPLDAIT